MKKILIVSAGGLPIPPVRGGAVESLIEFIVDQNEKANEFNIFITSCYDDDAVKLTRKYVNTKFEFIKINSKLDSICKLIIRFLNKVFNFGIPLNKLYYDSVARIIKSNKFDYVIAENCVEFMPYIFKKSVDTKFILHLHNDYLNSETKNAKLIIDNCNKIITVSEFIKGRVLTLGNEYSNKVRVLKNCTDTDKFNKDLYIDFKTNFKNSNSIAEDDVVVMFSGRLHPTKGIKELILAFSEVKNKNTKLLIVGSSWYGSDAKTEYAKEIEELSYKIKDRIIFTGFIPFNDMPKIYSVADICVVPSIWDDPAPLVVFEAMSTGLALITTNSGGISEYICKECVISHQRNENLVQNITNSLDELIENKHKRQIMGKRAREHALKFNTTQYYKDFVEILENDNG